MDKRLEERKKELESRFEEVKTNLKEASQKVSAYQAELVSVQGAYNEVMRLMEEPVEEKKK